MSKVFTLAIIAAFCVAGALPSATIVGSSSAYAAQTTGKIKKKHGYSAQKPGKKHAKSKMKKASPEM